MRIKDGYELVNRSGQNVVVSKRGSTAVTDNYIVLTDTAAFLWRLLSEKEVTKTQMLEALLENFNISTVLALGDIDIFIRTMKENGIIE
ncbi:MAG: PqqD family protein [Clostridia bacterium]|nr:PqqD family protein [Clostridia bacterium]